jgi:hypothetical protein
MPKLKPLQEWICDTYGDKLVAEDGWIEWLDPVDEVQGAHAFRIVHCGGPCYKHENHDACNDSHLDEFLGFNGLQKFLAMLDVGRVLDPTGNAIRSVPELRSFTDVIRRLHIPHYEEARLYFDTAIASGDFDSQNENSIFFAETCLAIIEQYEEK